MDLAVWLVCDFGLYDWSMMNGRCEVQASHVKRKLWSWEYLVHSSSLIQPATQCSSATRSWSVIPGWLSARNQLKRRQGRRGNGSSDSHAYSGLSSYSGLVLVAFITTSSCVKIDQISCSGTRCKVPSTWRWAWSVVRFSSDVSCNRYNQVAW